MKMIKLHVKALNFDGNIQLLSETAVITLNVDEIHFIQKIERNVVINRHMDEIYEKASRFRRLFMSKTKHTVEDKKLMNFTYVNTKRGEKFYVSEDIDEILSVLNG